MSADRCRPLLRHRPAAFRRLAVLIVVCAGGLAWPEVVVAQVKVEQTQWGFDGRAAASHFTPLSVEVSNTSADQVEVDLVLRRQSGIANPVDAPLLEKAFLAPFSSRWVQFYPYMTVSTTSCRLKLGDETIDIPSPRFNRFQRILLDDGTNLSSESSLVKSFPDQLFPPFVTATDGLQAVFLDHVPKWEEGRRTAFLEWLWLGGRLYLIQDGAGRFPQFSGEMAFLNAPLEEFSHGTGRIRRLELRRGGLNRGVLRGLFKDLPGDRIPLPAGSVVETTGNDPIEIQRGVEEAREEAEEAQEQQYGMFMRDDLLSAERLLTELKQMTRPQHSWLLLHFLFWIYIAAVFPGAYVLGLRLADYRWVYVGLGAAVTFFSIAFAIVGHRGYGERAAVYTTALIRPLPEAGWDVSGWSDAFVTLGSTYTIHHSGQGLLYATCQDLEPVRGLIQNGADASFTVDIPPYSSREFAHRVRTPGKRFDVRVKSCTPGAEGLAAFELTVGKDFPAEVRTCHAIAGNHIYLVSRDGDSFKLQTDLGTVANVLGLRDDSSMVPVMMLGYGEDESSQDERFSNLGQRLLAQAVHVGTRREARRSSLPADMLRLCIYTSLPEELAPPPSLGRNIGRAMYVLDLPLNASEQP